MRFAALFLALALPCAADEVHLTNGEVIHDCKVVDEGENYRLVKGAGSRLVAKSEVAKIIPGETLDEQHRKRSDALKPGDLDGRLKLARWCAEKGLKDAAAGEYLKIVAIDPDHEEARAALGHRRHDGRWMTEDEIRTAQGLVKHKGRWMSPEQRDLEIALEKQKEIEKQYAAEVARWTDRLSSSDPDRVREAKEKLAALDDEFKLKPFLSELRSTSDAARHFVLGELLRMLERIRGGNETIQSHAGREFARLSIWDSSVANRGLALQGLDALDHPSTTAWLLPYLGEESASARIRAMDAIGRAGDARAVQALADAMSDAKESLALLELYEKQIERIVKGMLVLKDGRKVPLPPGARIVGAGIDPATKQKLAEERDAALRALRSVSGQDFGDDAGAWSRWAARNRDRRP